MDSLQAGMSTVVGGEGLLMHLCELTARDAPSSSLGQATTSTCWMFKQRAMQRDGKWATSWSTQHTGWLLSLWQSQSTKYVPQQMRWCLMLGAVPLLDAAVH